MTDQICRIVYYILCSVEMFLVCLLYTSDAADD